MNTQIKEKYGVNDQLIRSMNTSVIRKLFATVYEIASLIIFLYLVFSLSETRWMFYEEIPAAVFYIVLGIDIVSNFISSIALSKKEINKGYIASVVSMAIWVGFSVFILVNGCSSDVEDACKTYIVCAIILIAVDKVLEYLEKAKNEVVIANLRKSYLHITDENICGISYSNVEQQGDGAYFELGFDEIKNLRLGSGADKYYNLYINHPQGTYKLSINGVKAAYSTLFAIRKNISEGKPSFEVKKSEPAAAPVKAEVKQETTIETDNNLVRCPSCDTWQGKNRTECYKCGYKFR